MIDADRVLTEPDWMADDRTASTAALASPERIAGAWAERLLPGGDAILDAPERVPAVWGDEDTGQVLWAKGEPALLVAPAGVGKTTVMAQVAKARLGLRDEVLGFPVEDDGGGLLVLACDRFSQIMRAYRRHTTEDERQVLNDRMRIWKGPPPADLAKDPIVLTQMGLAAGASTLMVDSVKDVAIGLSDDAVGAGLNSALQLAIANGMEVMATHHQRKGQGGAKPNTLEDVYGSTWITAGAGSVILLWGAAGDPIVELTHLKQPSSPVGPLKVEHDHDTGISVVTHGFDVLRYLRHRPNGASAVEAARAWFEKADPTDSQRRKAKRELDRLTRHEPPLAVRIEGTSGGEGGSQPDRYHATEDRR